MTEPGRVTLGVRLGDVSLTAEPVHRLALAIIPVDGLTHGPVPYPVRVGREVSRPPARRRRRGEVADPLARRLDTAALRSGKSAYVLLHRLDLPLAPGDGVREVVMRLDDPERRYVPRRLRVPLWSRRRVEAPDSDGTVPPIRAVERSVNPWLLPGSAYDPPGGTTGLRGRLRRGNDPVPWPRVRALGPANEVLGHAHGDKRGEFLLVLRTTGTIPPPAPSSLPIRLAFWVLDPGSPEPTDQRLTPDDPLNDLVIEDAVRRTPGAPPGSTDDLVLRGEAIPPRYVPAATGPRPAESFTVGELVQPDPYVLA